MRTHSLHVGLLLLILILLASSVQAQVVWEKSWGGGYDDACEIRNTRDGGSIMMAGYGVDSWILRLDANGDTLWTRRIRSPFDLCSITETLDGGFMAAGITRTVNRDLLAWKFNERGDSLWMRVYVDSLHTEGIYSILPRPDSSFVLSGYTSANGYDMLAIHIDSLGNQLWRKQYGSPSFEGGTVVAPTADGGYVMTTTVNSSSTPHIMVARTDALGDTLWTRHYLHPRPTGGPIPMVDNRGRILIMGWIERADYDNYLMCLDSAGTLLWAQAYPGLGFESRSARGVIQDRFGGYTFASSVDHAYGPPGADHDIALTRVDTGGLVTATYRLGHAADEMPRYFEQAANGDYLFAGYSGSFIPVGTQSYAARLRITGCVEHFYDLAGAVRDTVCPGDSLVLDAGAGYQSYLWSDSTTAQTHPITSSDTFYVVATDSAGCQWYSSAKVVLVMTGPTLTWAASGTLSVTFTAQPGDANQIYWEFGDGDSAQGAQVSHVYAQAGTYYVCMRAWVPNCGWEVICDSVTVTGPNGVLPGSAEQVRTWPNPAAGLVWMDHGGSESLQLEVVAMDGKMRLTQPIAPGKNAVNIAGLDAGVYLLRWTWPDGRTQQSKLVIAR